MAISGSDDMGLFVDSGVNTTPTVRANVEIDWHTATGQVEPDPDRGDKKLVLPPVAPRRSSTQRR